MSLLLEILEVLAVLIASILTVGIVTWTAGALYFDVARESRFALPLVLAWVGSVAAIFVVLQPLWVPFVTV